MLSLSAEPVPCNLRLGHSLVTVLFRVGTKCLQLFLEGSHTGFSLTTDLSGSLFVVIETDRLLVGKGLELTLLVEADCFYDDAL